MPTIFVRSHFNTKAKHITNVQQITATPHHGVMMLEEMAIGTTVQTVRVSMKHYCIKL